MATDREVMKRVLMRTPSILPFVGRKAPDEPLYVPIGPGTRGIRITTRTYTDGSKEVVKMEPITE